MLYISSRQDQYIECAIKHFCTWMQVLLDEFNSYNSERGANKFIHQGRGGYVVLPHKDGDDEKCS